MTPLEIKEITVKIIGPFVLSGGREGDLWYFSGGLEIDIQNQEPGNWIDFHYT